MANQEKIAILGGGICGLALALNLHRRGLSCRVYERVAEIIKDLESASKYLSNLSNGMMVLKGQVEEL